MFEWPIYKLRQGQVWFDVGFRRIPANPGLTQDIARITALHANHMAREMIAHDLLTLGSVMDYRP